MSIDTDGTVWSFGEPYSPVDSVEESEDDAECDGDVYTLWMSDSYGDGWHGNLFTIDGESYTFDTCLLYTSPSPRDVEESRMPSSA